MPENTTNRAYTYPLYTDPAGDFPAQIQLLATQLDTDIENLADTINAAYNKPAMSVSANLINQVIPNTTTTAADFPAGTTVHYDNANIYRPGTSTNTFYIPENGIYLMTCRSTFLSNGSTGARQIQISISNNGSSPAGIQNRKSLSGNPDVATAVALTVLCRCDAGATVQMGQWQWTSSGAPTMNSSTRVMSIAKVGVI